MLAYCHLNPEDDPERPPDSLEPLPDVNDKNYPQENQKYFRTKRYVRKDKYSLEQMIRDVEVPDLVKLYDMK